MTTVAVPTSAHVREYGLLRPATRRVERRLEETITAEALAHTGEVLGLYHDDEIDVPCDAAILLLADCALHEWPGDGNTLVRRFAESAEAARLPAVEQRVLGHMRDARLSLLRIDGSWPGVGVRVHDELLGRDLALLDRPLSREPGMEGVCVVARIFSPGGYWMATGKVIHLVPLGAPSLDVIRKVLDGTRLHDERDVGVTLARIAIDIESVLEEMEEGPGEEEEDVPPWVARGMAPLPPLPPRAPGRNDPCPCGSGKKYKKCCARAPRPADTR